MHVPQFSETVVVQLNIVSVTYRKAKSVSLHSYLKNIERNAFLQPAFFSRLFSSWLVQNTICSIPNIFCMGTLSQEFTMPFLDRSVVQKITVIIKQEGFCNSLVNQDIFLPCSKPLHNPLTESVGLDSTKWHLISQSCQWKRKPEGEKCLRVSGCRPRPLATSCVIEVLFAVKVRMNCGRM